MGTYALGIWVGTDFLHGALVEGTDDEWAVPVYRSWSRSGREEAGVPFGDEEASGPGMEGDANDLMIDFDDAGGDGGMMIGAEFEEVGHEGDGVGLSSAESWDFRAALDELLDECEEKGYKDPEIAFCAEAAMLDQIELRVPQEESYDYPEKKDGQSRPLPVERSRLLERLDEQYEGAVDSERVGFISMDPSEQGRGRALAFVARPGGSVISTLERMQEQTMARSPQARLFDVEVPLFAGLARSAMDLPAGSDDRSIAVRAGAEDTTILFMSGNTLRQVEHLPEITVNDPLETICSRVLLLQDEYQMGEVQHVLLASEDDEEELADAFRSYFSRSQLQLLRESLPGKRGPVPENVHVGAVGTALRILRAEKFSASAQGLNLLPKRCEPNRFRFPVGWSVPALLGVLALTTLVFVWYFIANANAISERRSELRRLGAQLEQMDAQEIRRQNENIKTAAVQYSEAVTVLNRLLEGSNKWSRSLGSTTAQIAEVGGISLRRWSPGEETVTLTGRATSRTRVVKLASRQGAQIDEITYTDVRDYPLYTFRLTIPLPSDRPEVVSYWRERVDSLRTDIDSTQNGNSLSSAHLFFRFDGSDRRVSPTGTASLSTAPSEEFVPYCLQDQQSGGAFRVGGSPSAEDTRHRARSALLPHTEATSPDRLSGRQGAEAVWKSLTVAQNQRRGLADRPLFAQAE